MGAAVSTEGIRIAGKDRYYLSWTAESLLSSDILMRLLRLLLGFITTCMREETFKMSDQTQYRFSAWNPETSRTLPLGCGGAGRVFA